RYPPVHAARSGGAEAARRGTAGRYSAGTPAGRRRVPGARLTLPGVTIVEKRVDDRSPDPDHGGEGDEGILHAEEGAEPGEGDGDGQPRPAGDPEEVKTEEGDATDQPARRTPG